jgi:hypothetical protein
LRTDTADWDELTEVLVSAESPDDVLEILRCGDPRSTIMDGVSKDAYLDTLSKQSARSIKDDGSNTEIILLGSSYVSRGWVSVKYKYG